MPSSSTFFLKSRKDLSNLLGINNNYKDVVTTIVTTLELDGITNKNAVFPIQIRWLLNNMTMKFTESPKQTINLWNIIIIKIYFDTITNTNKSTCDYNTLAKYLLKTAMQYNEKEYVGITLINIMFNTLTNNDPDFQSCQQYWNPILWNKTPLLISK